MKGKEIKKNIKKFPILQLHFRGLYTIDNIPTSLKATNFIIVNTSLSGSRGSHWVAIYLSTLKNWEIFDSLALYNNKLELELKKISSQKISFNSKILQDSKSKNCGVYCIYFILYRLLYLDYNLNKLILKIFSEDKNINEKTIKQFKKWLI